MNKLEQWLPIKDYPNYAISDRGRVFSWNIRNYMKINNHYEKQYQQIKIFKDSKLKNYSIHVLVAMHFIDNYNKDLEVNHKNFDRTDNRLENLECISHDSNIEYSKKAGRFNKSDELKYNLSILRKGENNPMYGKTQSNKTKLLMSLNGIKGKKLNKLTNKFEYPNE